jgi:hypothetical protein
MTHAESLTRPWLLLGTNTPQAGPAGLGPEWIGNAWCVGWRNCHHLPTSPHTSNCQVRTLSPRSEAPASGADVGGVARPARIRTAKPLVVAQPALSLTELSNSTIFVLQPYRDPIDRLVRTRAQGTLAAVNGLLPPGTRNDSVESFVCAILFGAGSSFEGGRCSTGERAASVVDGANLELQATRSEGRFDSIR